MFMNKNKLNQLILECVKEHKLKVALKALISEAIEEIKEENQKSCQELVDELESEVQKINKDFYFAKDDAGFYKLNGCPPHMVKLYHKYNDLFDVTYFKDGTDRVKKLNVPIDELKKFLKEKLDTKTLNYTKTAYNKSAANSVPAEGKDLNVPQKTEKEVVDAVKNEDDLPDKPMKPVASFKKQNEHSLKGEKVDYKYPKQKNNKLVVKLPSKKQRAKKS